MPPSPTTQGERVYPINRLYFILCQLDRCFYPVKHDSSFHRGKIGENGFNISRDRIYALGLESVFREGASIRFSKFENKMLIEVDEGQPNQAMSEDFEEESEGIEMAEPLAQNEELVADDAILSGVDDFLEFSGEQQDSAEYADAIVVESELEEAGE